MAFVVNWRYISKIDLKASLTFVNDQYAKLKSNLGGLDAAGREAR